MSQGYPLPKVVVHFVLVFVCGLFHYFSFALLLVLLLSFSFRFSVDLHESGGSTEDATRQRKFLTSIKTTAEDTAVGSLPETSHHTAEH